MRLNDQHQFVYLLVLWILCVSSLIACTTTPSKQEIGTVIGSVSGGVVGSLLGKKSHPWLGAGVGTVIGGLVGSFLGKSMDDYDRKMTTQTLDKNATGVPAVWHNPRTGNDYTLTPVSDIEDIDGRQCRKFTQQAIVDGKPESIEGIACKESEGENWI